jgi:hypothetical protein
MFIKLSAVYVQAGKFWLVFQADRNSELVQRDYGSQEGHAEGIYLHDLFVQ